MLRLPAPAEGTTPNAAFSMLPTPCAISSALLLGRFRVRLATDTELITGDALVREARQLAQEGRRADALASFAAGLSAWSGAAQAARTRAAQAAAAATPPRADAPPPVVTQPVPSDPRPLIEQAIAAYARALESRDVEAVRRAYPGLTRRQEDAWRGLFQGVRELRADLKPSSIQVEGTDAARASVGGTLELVSRDGRQRQPITFQAALERAAGGWVIR